VISEVVLLSRPGFFSVDECLKRLSDIGDQLETYAQVFDFEIFRSDLVEALNYSDGLKGVRPPYDCALMFKVLLIQAQNNLSDDRTELLISGRLLFMRFLGLGLSDRVPNAKTIWAFRLRLTQASAIDRMFTCFDRALRDVGYIGTASWWTQCWPPPQAAQLGRRETGNQVW